MPDIDDENLPVFKRRVSGNSPRTYRPHRQRIRPALDRTNASKDAALRRPDQSLRMEPDHTEGAEDPLSIPRPARETLCLSDPRSNTVLHDGVVFAEALRRLAPPSETLATERLVQLKLKLALADTHEFWRLLMEEMCEVMGAQCGFVAKRMLVDDQDSAVEMPELGQPGSCLMALAFYLNNGEDVKKLYRDYRYHAYGTPCAYMKHDKVFIVPANLAELTPDNPNVLPWARSEAYIGVPLFSDGKCFAHFGMIWSSEGAKKRNLSWAFIEMFMHALEDQVLQRILDGKGFVQHITATGPSVANVIPLSAITAAQSLKPYARSLSHELRTPMQGVVGMLDIMYSTVVDAIVSQPDEHVRSVFLDLKGHIEIVQDSSKRAVEAADNVVHAYDLNMQMPETVLTPEETPLTAPDSIRTPDSREEAPSILVAGPNMLKKHERDESDYHPGPPLKRMYMMSEREAMTSYFSQPSGNASLTMIIEPDGRDASTVTPELVPCPSVQMQTPQKSPTAPLSSHRRIVIRDFMQASLKEALRSDHPISEIHTETPLGETIHVKSMGPKGDVLRKTIHLTIEEGVPLVVIAEEHHLKFALLKVLDNALKFTESGSITAAVKLSSHSHTIEVWVADTGRGMTEDSKSSLFTPHFQEDSSTSRSRDGLGLSLFNAKAHVRRNLGGDLTLEQTATEGPFKGSQFLIRVPISSLHQDGIDAPFIGTPPPQHAQLARPPLYSNPSVETTVTELVVPPTTPNTSIPSVLPKVLSTKPVSRKRVAFNSHLAEKYPLKFLIAEDNAINRNVAIGSLNKLGYSKEQITLAVDGVEAVRQYEASLTKPASDHFSAILMDIWMPNMDGYEATSKILDLAKTKGERTTVIAVTADITGDCAEKAKEVGMQGFLAKPYKVLDIEKLIVEHFSRLTVA